MGLFGNGRKKKDEYDVIYDDEDSRNYEELDENEDHEEVIERLRGTIGRGDCLYCNGKNTIYFLFREIYSIYYEEKKT